MKYLKNYLFFITITGFFFNNNLSATFASACQCLPYYSPVCSPNGMTFDNICKAQCAGQFNTRPGRCENYSECPHCGLEGQNMPSRPFYPNQLPSWGWSQYPYLTYQNNLYPYGDIYSNFRYPGPWMKHGIDDSAYRGRGEMMALKPNIYVISSEKVSVNIKIDTQVEMIAISPVPNENNSWVGELENDQFRFENANSKIPAASYDYLFYDFRSSTDHLNFEYYFCGSKGSIIAEMIDLLYVQKYPMKAVKDFQAHWEVKIPNDYPEYCMFLQPKDSFSKIAKIEISTNKPNSFYRLNFLLIPIVDKKSPLISIKNKMNTIHAYKKILATETIEDKSQIRFFEWGVEFLTTQGYEKIINNL